GETVAIDGDTLRGGLGVAAELGASLLAGGLQARRLAPARRRGTPVGQRGPHLVTAVVGDVLADAGRRGAAREPGVGAAELGDGLVVARRLDRSAEGDLGLAGEQGR